MELTGGNRKCLAKTYNGTVCVIMPLKARVNLSRR
jgi:hypothetical protein